MLIPLIPKNPDSNDFSCRDGEIDWVLEPRLPDHIPSQSSDSLPNLSLTMVFPPLEQTIRIPLEKDDKEKAELMLSGQISRVDAATAERLTQAMVQKAAEALLDISTDLRRQGCFILPFRVYTILRTPDGNLSYPSPQAVALPADFPPHPEITAASATDDSLTLALRFPVRPHRLSITPQDNLPEGYSLQTFISYPLYIPDPKEIRGSIGSVRSADGANATGIRFAFLSASALKSSVAAPEKYHELVGNERTGYRLSSKAATLPDYSCYAALYGYVTPFPRASLLALGEDAATDTDPLDWIADWVKAECARMEETEQEGYLPASLPHKFWHYSDSSDSAGTSDPSAPHDWSELPDLLAGLEGIDADFIRSVSDESGLPFAMLTRPMTFATDSVSRRHATPTAIRTLRVLGLDPAKGAHAILYGSDDGVRWTPLRRFNPRVGSKLLTPPRLLWRLLIWSADKILNCALSIVHCD